jgi:uncharacterized membrane protein YccC
MEEAERIRTTLTVVAGSGLTAAPSARARSAHLTASAGALDEIAQALRARPAARGDHLDRARQYVDHDPDPAGHSWTWAGESLHGQLRSAIRITERLNDAEPGRGGRPGGRATVRLPAHDLLVTLRANLGTSSEAGRHALRLAVVTGLAAVIAQWAGLPHSYWAALTVLIVLRPDYGSTLYRGVQRAGGTLVGVGLGLATVLLGHLGSAALLAGVAASIFAAYALLTVNYLIFAVFLTDFVVVLLALLGLPADQTAPDRLIGTGLGTGLALLAYVLWPTWERTTASEKFARLFLAQSRFAALMLAAYSRPAGDDLVRSRPAKLAARRARSDAEDSADRIADQPERPPMTRAFTEALVSAGHRLALAGLAVEAATRQRHVELRRAEQAPPPQPRGAAGAGPAAAGDKPAGAGPEPAGAGQPAVAGPDPVQPQLDKLADSVRQAGAQLAESLHRLGPPGPLPPLRALQSQLPGDDGDSTALFTATDGLVDALNTTAATLRRHLTPPAPEPPGTEPPAAGPPGI